MRIERALSLLLLAAMPPMMGEAAALTGRFSMLGATAQTRPGDLGYQLVPGNILSADQEGLRLMLDEAAGAGEWSIHLRTVRLHSHGLAVAPLHSSALFRYEELGGTIFAEGDGTTSTLARYELDRLYYRRHFDDFSLGIGRQAIDWGSGRFWQPLNVFGNFAPTDLDTDYKPGIDTVVLDYYPSAFSSLSVVYAAAPEGATQFEPSGALYYRRQLVAGTQMALLGASISGNAVAGGSLEGAWGGVGWRIEGVHYRLQQNDTEGVFWIAGIDYALQDGTLFSAEYHDNSRGADSVGGLAAMVDDELVVVGLQQHLSRQLVGLGMARDLTPLLHGGYTLLGGTLKDEAGEREWSLLHQFRLTYSVSNEADLVVALLLPSGRGLSAAGEPQSEFGHLPASLSLRLRFYF